MKVELFYAPGCEKCADNKEKLRATAAELISDLVWRELKVLDDLDYAIELGVLTLPGDRNRRGSRFFLTTHMPTTPPRTYEAERQRITERTPYMALLKAMVAMAPACMVLFGSVVMFIRRKTLPLFLQLFGAGCLLVVVLTHVFEALQLFPWMRWGGDHSAGHYLDFGSALLGLTLFPIGYLLHAITK